MFVLMDTFLWFCYQCQLWSLLIALILNYKQVGSRITSNRISQMLEKCSPCSYIMVDSHQCRHDPSHIVTHRIESTVVEFSSCLLKATSPNKNSKWSSFLQILNMMVIDPRQWCCIYYMPLCTYVLLSHFDMFLWQHLWQYAGYGLIQVDQCQLKPY